MTTTSDIDITAIVIALGEFKRIPGKNMADICEKSLMSYFTITAPERK